MNFKWTLPLSPAQKVAWDHCPNEHGFEHPCYKCENLAKDIKGAFDNMAPLERRT